MISRYIWRSAMWVRGWTVGGFKIQLSNSRECPRIGDAVWDVDGVWEEKHKESLEDFGRDHSEE
jgi:hypothetical protein